MYSIAYIIPYFGKLRNDIKIWLHSVAFNPTVDFLVFTDDKIDYGYPKNVHVFYTTFERVRSRIQELFDFEIELSRPYKLCGFKVTYGEVFEEELREYDFWGYCDMDLMWGDIRSIITNDVLKKYDKIGFQGHSTLYRNTKENNCRYRIEISGKESFHSAFTSEKTWNFDEKSINCIYNSVGVPFYSETTFSTLAQYRHNFVARYWMKKESNKNVIYMWEKGKLFHVSAYRREVHKDEIMYVHWQKRKMKVECEGTEDRIIIVPNRILPCKQEPSYSYIIASSKPRWITYLRNIFADNKGASIMFWMKYAKRFILYNWRVKFHNEIKQDING